MTRSEKAKQLFLEGYACSQALVLAFSDIINIDQETLKKVSLPFGGGIGRLRLTCGAFSSMIMIASLLSPNYNTIEENKINIYAIVQELSQRFETVFSTKVCSELLQKVNVDVEIGGKPDQRNEQYYNKRPCGNIVFESANILEQYLIEQNILKK